jgi:hypothetical protein
VEASPEFLERLLDMEPELVEGGTDAFSEEDFIDDEDPAAD